MKRAVRRIRNWRRINATFGNVAYGTFWDNFFNGNYEARTGYKVGYKPAGGISKAREALTYLVLMKEELDGRWLRPARFRFGASSLLGDIERQLEHHVSGGYSASHRHPLG